MSTTLLLFMFAVHITSTPKREVWAPAGSTDRVELKPAFKKRPAKSLKTAFRNRTVEKSRSSDVEIIKHWSKNVFRELFYSDLNSALKDGMRILDENRYRELKMSESKKIGQYLGDWDAMDKPLRRILILTTWRSGSTFLGELLSMIPGTFYSFEPLLEKLLRNDRTSRPPPSEILSGVLNCNLSQHEFGESMSWVLKHNRRYYDMCTALMMRKSYVEYNLCSSTKIMENACRRLPIHLAKTVRFRMSQLKELMAHMPDLKVVALFRDPRGILSSRERLEWCGVELCNNYTRGPIQLEKIPTKIFSKAQKYNSKIRYASINYLFLQIP